MTTIGPNTHVEGRVEGDEDVTVEGRVVGAVALTQSLTVAHGGVVDGDIVARVVVVQGAISGTIKATELLHLTPSARVTANISSPTIQMDDGAQLRGEVEMDLSAAPAPRTSKPARVSKPTPVKVVAEAPAETESITVTESISVTAAPKARNSERSTATTVVTVIDEDADDGIGELTVKDLRDRLRELDLPVSGTKQELVERLAEATE